MRKLIVATMVLTLSGLSPVLARGGGHGGGMVGGIHNGGMIGGMHAGMLGGGMHRSMSALANPANPSVPPSLTPDPRLIGSAPLPPHQQPRAAAGTVNASMYNPTPDEAALDKKIGSICKGC
jgi:hypothetical protein